MENLINLLQLEQDAAIILDRDRDGPGEELKPAEADLEKFDLKEKITDLALRIRKANGLSQE